MVDRGTGEARAAVIARRNRAGRVEWCLPKGHIEPGETPEQAAVREVAEETGIRGPRAAPRSAPSTTGSPRTTGGCTSSCTTTCSRPLGGDLTIEDDPDHEAIDVAWVPLQQLDERLTFPNERRIAREATALLEDTA